MTRPLLLLLLALAACARPDHECRIRCWCATPARNTISEACSKQINVDFYCERNCEEATL